MNRKKGMKKRVLAMFLSMVFVIGVLGGCANQPADSSSNDSTAEEATTTEEASTTEEATAPTEDSTSTEATATGELKPFKLGWIGAGSADLMADFIRPVKWACDVSGGELVADFSSTSAESQIAVLENLISGGCNLISITNFFGDAPLAQISKICQENEVYWVLWDVIVNDTEILDILKNDPYFVGFTQEDQTKVGADGMQALVDAGCKNIIIYTYAVGVYTADTRLEAVKAVCEENGVNVVDVLEAPEDTTKAMADSLIAHPDADGLFATGGLLVPLLSAITESGRDLKVGYCDLFEGIEQYFDEGIVLSVDGGHTVSNFVAVMMLLNAHNGTPLTTGADIVEIPLFTFTSSEQYQKYAKYCLSDTTPVYTAEDLPLFLKVLNADLTLESFQQNIYDTWNLDNIAEKFSE